MNLNNIWNRLSDEIGQIARSLRSYAEEYAWEVTLMTVGLLLLLFAFPGFAELRTMLIVLLAETFCLWLIYRSYTILKSHLPDLNYGQLALGVHVSVGMVILGVYMGQY